MLEIKAMGNLQINVPNLEEAEKFYQDLFGAPTFIHFPHFKNEGLSHNLGIQDAEISMKYLRFPKCNLILKLVSFHQPTSSKESPKFNLNDEGGPRHISLRVAEIEKAFNTLTGKKGIEMFNQNGSRPSYLSEISPETLKIECQNSDEEKKKKDKLLGHLTQERFFFFRDKYGVIWEIQQKVQDPNC